VRLDTAAPSRGQKSFLAGKDEFRAREERIIPERLPKISAKVRNPEPENLTICQITQE
jgi:hypothetical protein